MTDVTITETVTTVSVSEAAASVTIVEPVTQVTIIEGALTPDPEEPAYDADAETLFAAMSSEPDDTRKQLISDTIVSLKSAGIWDELDELWMLAAHSEQAGLLGWKRYRDCLAVNAPTFTVDEGFAGNGTTSYLNTQFVPSTDGVLYTLNDASLGVYSRTDISQNSMDIGARVSSLEKTTLLFGNWSDGKFYAQINQDTSTGRINVAVSDSLGLLVARRTSSNALQGYKNGVEIGAGTSPSAALTTITLFVCAYNDNGTPDALSTRQYAFAFVGAALSEAQQSDLFDIVESHLDSIGAGVVA